VHAREQILADPSHAGDRGVKNESGAHALSKSSIDTSLSCDSVTSGWEELRDTRSVEASLGQTEGSAQTGTASANDDSIVFVVLNRSVFSRNSQLIAWNHTMMGYFYAMGPSASFARSGWFANIRAGGRSVSLGSSEANFRLDAYLRDE
jgi:hypothetical protein